MNKYAVINSGKCGKGKITGCYESVVFWNVLFGLTNWTWLISNCFCIANVWFC